MTTLTSVCPTHDVRLDITVWPEVWRGLYDRIEVHRSVLGEAGPYKELTGEGWRPAILPIGAGPSSSSSGPRANLVGKKLEVLVGMQHLSFTFAGNDPLTFAQAALQVADAGAGLLDAYVDASGRFVLQSLAVGGQARLEVVGGDAAPLLGLPVLPPESVAYGKDPRIVLVDGTQGYAFRDYFGKKIYFYRVRFSNVLSGARSAFSGPISAVPDAGLAASRLVTGYVKLVRGDGMPDVKQAVTIHTPSTGQQVDGATVNGGQRVFLTDATGRIEARLIRGTRVDVGIGGMNLMRTVVVPTDPSVESFDLLSPEYGTDDTFAVKRLDIPAAKKMSL